MAISSLTTVQLFVAGIVAPSVCVIAPALLPKMCMCHCMPCMRQIPQYLVSGNCAATSHHSSMQYTNHSLRTQSNFSNQLKMGQIITESVLWPHNIQGKNHPKKEQKQKQKKKKNLRGKNVFEGKKPTEKNILL